MLCGLLLAPGARRLPALRARGRAPARYARRGRALRARPDGQADAGHPALRAAAARLLAARAGCARPDAAAAGPGVAPGGTRSRSRRLPLLRPVAPLSSVRHLSWPSARGGAVIGRANALRSARGPGNAAGLLRRYLGKTLLARRARGLLPPPRRGLSPAARDRRAALLLLAALTAAAALPAAPPPLPRGRLALVPRARWCRSSASSRSGGQAMADRYTYVPLDRDLHRPGLDGRRCKSPASALGRDRSAPCSCSSDSPWCRSPFDRRGTGGATRHFSSMPWR